MSIHAAAGRAEAKDILGAINGTLHDASLLPEGARLVSLRFLGAETRREADGITWRGTIRFHALTEITE